MSLNRDHIRGRVMGRSEPQSVPPDLQPEGHMLPSLLQVLHTHQHRDSYLRPGGPESLPKCPPWAALSGMRPLVLILHFTQKLTQRGKSFTQGHAVRECEDGIAAQSYLPPNPAPKALLSASP